MNTLFGIYRWMLHNPLLEAINCIFWGVMDMIVRFIYALLGRDSSPDFMHGWQECNFCFHPQVQYPLRTSDRRNQPRLSWLDAHGMYTGAVVFRYLPVEEIRSFLPPGLTLNLQLTTSAGRYPVVYLFGFQQDLRQSWMITHGVNYLEFCIGALGVNLADFDPSRYCGPFLYMPRLFLNRLYPTILGLLCCYSKRWASISTTHHTYRVSSLLGRRCYFEGRFETSGPIGGPDDFPSFTPWRHLLNRPSANHFSGRHYIYLDYDWGWSHALLQPLKGEIEVFEAGLPGLPRGIYRFEHTGGDDLGAFRIAIPFEWVPPFRRAELRPGIGVGLSKAARSPGSGA